MSQETGEALKPGDYCPTCKQILDEYMSPQYFQRKDGTTGLCLHFRPFPEKAAQGKNEENGGTMSG